MPNKILHSVIWGGVLLVVVLLLMWNRLFPTPSPEMPTDWSVLIGIQTSDAPWPAEVKNLASRLKTIGLPALPEEGTVLHIHQHIDIFVNGVAVAIPSGIGINRGSGFIASVHTHNASGIIHIESPTVQTFTLGQFFDIWGVKFGTVGTDCLGSYCVGDDKNLRVYVNGTLYAGDLRSLELKDHQEIVVTYGTERQLPNPIPVSYSFESQ